MFSEIRSDLVTDAPRCALASPSLVWASVGSVNDVICKVISQAQPVTVTAVYYSVFCSVGRGKMRVFTDFGEE